LCRGRKGYDEIRRQKKGGESRLRRSKEKKKTAVKQLIAAGRPAGVLE